MHVLKMCYWISQVAEMKPITEDVHVVSLSMFAEKHI